MEGWCTCPSAENENRLHFSATSAASFCLFVVVLGSALLPGVICETYMIGQLLIARSIITIVLEKAAIFHHGLEWALSGQIEVDFA